MNNAKILPAAIASFLVCMASRAEAISPLTNSFIANVRPNIEFLSRSSKLALERSHKKSVKTFAEAMVDRQAIAANSLTAWWQSNTPEGSAAALGTGEPSTFDLDPLHLLPKTEPPNPPQDKDASVIDGVPVLSTRMPKSMPQKLLPAQKTDFENLRDLEGSDFDAFYSQAERNSLRQLSALYRDYSLQGDDPALRSIAAVQLPRINDAIRELNEVR